MTTAREEAIAAGLSPPLVHMNGTSRDSLLAGYMAAIEALQAALPALRATHPNGRDYYPISELAIVDAVKQDQIRVRAVELVIAQLTLLAAAVQE